VMARRGSPPWRGVRTASGGASISSVLSRFCSGATG
jgi:hypothetical protein